jgi:hypothetical protein
LIGLSTSSKASCRTCRFWRAEQDQREIVLGECRILPPRINPLPGDPEDPDTVAGLPRRPWPMTEDTDWCRPWRRARV